MFVRTLTNPADEGRIRTKNGRPRPLSPPLDRPIIVVFSDVEQFTYLTIGILFLRVEDANPAVDTKGPYTLKPRLRFRAQGILAGSIDEGGDRGLDLSPHLRRKF